MKALEKEVKDFPEGFSTKLDRLCSTVTFNQGQVIYYKDHLPYGLFFLTDGSVEIKKGKKTKNLIPMKVLGVNSFLNRKAYSYTVRALSDCTLKFLSSSSYRELLIKKDPILKVFVK